MVDVATMKLRYDGTELRRAPGDLNAVTEAAKGTEAQTTKVGASAKRAGMEMGRAGGGGVRMLSMQLSQVAQQGAVTGNYFRALTTQAADIGLAFGTVGIAVGAALTVFGSLITGASKASSELNDLDEVSLSGVRGELNALRDLQSQYTDAISLGAVAQTDATRIMLGALSKEFEARAALMNLRRLEMQDQLLLIQEDVEERRRRFNELVRMELALIDAQDDSGGFARNRASEARVEAVRRVVAENEELVRGLKRGEARAKLIEMALQEVAAALTRGAKITSEMGDGLIGAEKAATSLREELGDAAVEALQLAGVDITGGISDAAKAAAVLAANLGSSLEMAARISAMASAARAGDISQIPGEGATQAVRNQQIETLQGRWAAHLRSLSRIERGGGGGAGGAAVRNESLEQLKRLYRETRTEAEMFAIQLKELDELFAATDGFAGYGGQDTYNRKLQSLREEFQELPSLAQDAAGAIRSAFDGLFDDPAQALENLAKELAQMALFATLARGFPGIFGPAGVIPLQNAGGNAFMGGRVIPFAHGGVVSGPALFPMKNGTGMMGEAGPEAIMPLKRGADGKLGVAGGGGTVVTIINNSGQPVRESRERGPDGRELVSIVVGEELARGSFDRQLNGRYGSQPRVVRR